MDYIETVAILHLVAFLKDFEVNRRFPGLGFVDENVVVSEKYEYLSFEEVSKKVFHILEKNFYFEVRQILFVNTHILPDMSTVSMKDVKIKDNEKLVFCSYTQFEKLLCHYLQRLQQMQPELTEEQEKMYSKLFQTRYTPGRITGQLKQFFLCMKYGGINAWKNYVDLFFISHANVCSESRKISNIIRSLEEEDLECVYVFSDEELAEAPIGANNPVIIIDAEKMSKKFKIPLSLLDRINIRVDCSSKAFEILVKNYIIKSTYNLDIEKRYMCKKNIFHPEKFIRTGNHTRILDAFTFETNRNIANLVLNLLVSEYRPERSNQRDCQIQSLPFLKTDVEAFNSLIETHLKILNASLEEEQKNSPKLELSNLQLKENIITILQKINLDYWLSGNFPTNTDLFIKLKHFTLNFLMNNSYDFFQLLTKDNENIQSLKIQKNYFQALLLGDVISDTSAEGVVWLLRLWIPKLKKSDIPPYAIMKYQRDAPKDNTGDLRYPNILHELTVGIMLNKLREKIPNFMYTLGGFLCSPPSQDSGLNVNSNVKYDYNFINFCLHSKVDKLKIMMLNEVIPAKYNFNEYLQKHNDRKKEICAILIQLFYALYIAYKEFKFVHGDLHQENVLIVKTTDSTTITIEMDDGETFQIKNVKRIPVIIDYGFSSIYYNKKRLAPFKSTQLTSSPTGTKLRNIDYNDELNDYISEDVALLLSPFVVDYLNFAKPLVNMPLRQAIIILGKFLTSDNSELVFPE